ncbi:MAG: class I SAM-dependent rRNA methyltransferase [Planctomycetes bacterium]|nr:class I SAM-dependent rRNA methyltransferase [Planctomycetota bacterium]
MKSLKVSRSTANFIKRGHPWVRVDAHTEGLDTLQCGEAINLCDERGKVLASALADPQSSICARVYHRLPNKDFDIQQALERASNRRQILWDDDTTNCFRLVHGEADFLPGLRIEVYNHCMVILCRSLAMLAHKDELLSTLKKLFPAFDLIFKKQIQDIRTEKVEIECPAPMHSDSRIWARELDSEVCVFPCQDLACGIYVDQRATRTYLHQHCQGKDIANTFSYTGFFSSSLLQAGAQSAIDIDIAQPALDVARENAEKNAVADRHRIHCGDSGHYFTSHQDMFDIIILDPPTAAQGKSKGKNKKSWLLRKDYPLLIEAAWKRLRKDGLLVACCNTLGQKKQFRLKQYIEQNLTDYSDETSPPLGIDIPQLKGFPEGRPYELSIIKKNCD